MKKIIYSLVIISFVFGLAAIPATNAQEQEQNQEQNQEQEHNANLIMSNETEGLEKVDSPDEIKYFRIMKKIGNTLFGIRKATSTERVEPKKMENDDSFKLEKIDHPSVINMFERIQKIGTALWGYKKKATSTPSYVISPEIAACVSKAIDTKDKALMTRVTAAAVELNAALTARSTCQQTAVIASSTPREAVNACVKTFNVAHKAIREASKKVQKDTWTAYQEGLKACRTAATSTVAVPMVEDGGSIFD